MFSSLYNQKLFLVGRGLIIENLSIKILINIVYIILLLILLLIGYVIFKEFSKSAKEKKQQPGYKFLMNYYKFLGILTIIFSVSYIFKLIFEIFGYIL